ncbi:MAG: ABC transporter permease, partial [Thaumarchaeota archaeon]
PLTTLILSGIGASVIITRGAIFQELKQDYVLTARAKGLSETQVLFRHVLRNSLLPLITFTALNFGYILAGAILVEIVFSWNGHFAYARLDPRIRR